MPGEGVGCPPTWVLMLPGGMALGDLVLGGVIAVALASVGAFWARS
jgi:hypothetical protein